MAQKYKRDETNTIQHWWVGSRRRRHVKSSANTGRPLSSRRRRGLPWSTNSRGWGRLWGGKYPPRVGKKDALTGVCKQRSVVGRSNGSVVGVDEEQGWEVRVILNLEWECRSRFENFDPNPNQILQKTRWRLISRGSRVVWMKSW